MNNTKAKLEAIVPFALDAKEHISPDAKVHLTFEADITLEDWELFKTSQEYMNKVMERDDDMGDHMLALLTWAIHKSYEARTGKPFKLRMDRPKN